MGGLTITPEQRAALAKLAPVLPSSCYLAGGVAVAVHFAHRLSKDLDLFTPTDPAVLVPQLDQLPGLQITNQAAGTIYMLVDGVEVSLLHYRYPLIAPGLRAPGIPVDVASIEDLACMKLGAIVSRGAARDFWDLHTIITVAKRPLPDLLAVYQRKHPTVDVGHVVRGLVYFDDAEAQPLPLGLDATHWGRIRDDLRRWVTALVDAG